jgi:hypothetical protein
MKALLSCAVLALSCLTVGPATAQTQSVHDTATAYGARLDAKGRPVDNNRNRNDDRIDSRINNRLTLRVERYRPDSTENPTGAFRAPPDDKSRTAAVIAPFPGTDK